jgi:riboflavin transporter FmnP
MNIDNRTKKLTTLAIMTAIAFVLTFVRIPVGSFLTYDPADIMLLIAGFLLGPFAGVVSVLVVVVLEAITSSTTGPWGAFMHFIASATIVVASSLLYKLFSRKRNSLGEKPLAKKRALPLLASLIIAGVLFVVVMICMNILITPIFMGVPREVVLKMILPVLLPFNALKALANITLTYFIYLAVENLAKKYLTNG